jgi:hypothetical protein
MGLVPFFFRFLQQQKQPRVCSCRSAINLPTGMYFSLQVRLGVPPPRYNEEQTGNVKIIRNYSVPSNLWPNGKFPSLIKWKKAFSQMCQERFSRL